MKANDYCRAAVVVLHRFFEAWMGGCLTDAEAFGALESALALDFEMVNPSGQLLDRQAVLEGVRGARSVHAASDPPFRIWIEAVRTRVLGENWYLVSYEEWQQLAGKVTVRLSTALLQGDGSALRWRHLHETWRAGFG